MGKNFTIWELNIASVISRLPNISYKLFYNLTFMEEQVTRRILSFNLKAIHYKSQKVKFITLIGGSKIYRL